MKTTGVKDKSPIKLQLKHTLHGHTGPVQCLATSASYNLIVSGSKVSVIMSRCLCSLHVHVVHVF